MPKTKISEFSATAGNNTDIDGINIAEGCAPSGINDAIRELMAQLKDFQAGTAGDSFNGPIGATTPAAGTFTNLSASGTFALTGDQVQISEGGTGQTTANAAFNALAPSQSTHAGKYLKTDGTNTSWDALDISTADITGTLPIANGGTGLTALGTGVQTALGQNVTGSGGIVLASSPSLTTPNLGTPSAVTLTNATGLPLSTGVTGTLGTTNGGTGLTSFTANGVVYASSSSALTTGSALTFDGTNLGIGTSSPATRVHAVGDNVAFRGQLSLQTATAANFAQMTFYDRTTLGARIFQSYTGVAGVGDLTIQTDGASSALVFGTNNTEGMRLTSTSLYTASGISVGIGTSSPSTYGKLAVVGAGTTEAYAVNTSTTGQASWFAQNNVGGRTGIFQYGSAQAAYGAIGSGEGAVYSNTSTTIMADGGSATIKFATGGNTTKMTLDSSGNLGLGVTPSAWETANSVRALQLNGGQISSYSTTYLWVGQNFYRDSTSTEKYVNNGFASKYQQNSGIHSWYYAASGTAGNTISFTQAMTLDANNNLGLGTTSLSNYANQTTFTINGTNYGRIDFNASNVIKGSIFGGGSGLNLDAGANQLLMYAGSAERARITSDGNLLVGITTDQFSRIASDGGTGNAVWGKCSTAATAVNITWNSATSGDNLFESFFTDGGPSLRGSIDYNRAGGLVRYNITSDYRAKDIIGPVQNTGTTIDALKVYEGVMKGATQARPMMIAHEAQEVVPFCVSGAKDETNEDGTPKYQQMDHASLVPLLIAEIQSLRARVAQLEAK